MARTWSPTCRLAKGNGEQSSLPDDKYVDGNAGGLILPEYSIPGMNLNTRTLYRKTALNVQASNNHDTVKTAKTSMTTPTTMRTTHDNCNDVEALCGFSVYFFYRICKLFSSPESARIHLYVETTNISLKFG